MGRMSPSDRRIYWLYRQKALADAETLCCLYRASSILAFIQRNAINRIDGSGEVEYQETK